jgi:hypothetical protein
MQRFDSYEVIVCDNCSSIETQQVVRSFDSPKVKYVRSDVPLAMSDNWDLAVSQAQGEFVTVLGDDDGLLQHALQVADDALSTLGVKAFRWDKLYYHWPDQSRVHPANYLSIPLVPSRHETPYELLQSTKVISSVICGRCRYPQLPMIYNSFIQADLISTLRQRTGRVFKAITPDVYSGFAFASLLKRFGSTTMPLGIEGVSGKSNGAATFLGDDNNSIAKEFKQLNCTAGLQWNRKVPQVNKSISAVVAESFEQVKENLGASSMSLSVDRRAMVKAIVDDVRRMARHLPGVQTEARSAIEQWAGDDDRLRKWIDSLPFSNGSVPCSSEAVGWQGRAKGFDGWSFSLNAAEFGIQNTCDVAAFYDKLIGAFDSKAASARRQGRIAAVRDISTSVAREMTPPIVWKLLRGVAHRLTRTRQNGQLH